MSHEHLANDTNDKGRDSFRYHLNVCNDKEYTDLQPPDKNVGAMCFCRCYATLKIGKLENNIGRLYWSCGQEKKCNFFQWAEMSFPETTTEWSGFSECENRHPSRDAQGYPMRGYDIPGPPPRSRSVLDDIEVINCTNEIVFPPELKGLIYTRELEELLKQEENKKK